MTEHSWWRFKTNGYEPLYGYSSLEDACTVVGILEDATPGKVWSREIMTQEEADDLPSPIPGFLDTTKTWSITEAIHNEDVV